MALFVGAYFVIIFNFGELDFFGDVFVFVCLVFGFLETFWRFFLLVFLYAPREIDSDLFMKFLQQEEVMLGSCCHGGR